jgi:dTMP kinase
MFIIFEGPDWVGKTTLINSVGEALKADAHFSKRIIITREPGGTKLGEKIREILFNSEEFIDPIAESFLFLADRAQHIKEVISKHNENTVVMSDRYDLTMAIYQGLIKNAANFSDLLDIEQKLKFPVPDLGIILLADKPLINKEDTFMEKFDFDWNDINQKYSWFITENRHEMLKYPKLAINSSNNTIEESTDIVVSAIKTLCNFKSLKGESFVL